MEKIIYKKDEISDICTKLFERLSSKILCLNGSMGVGKTTLVKSFIENLGGTSEQVNSPTFGLVNEYHDDSGEVLAYHFDFYRIESEDELFNLGLEDYFAGDIWIFIEWGEKIGSHLPDNAHHIFLHFIDENTRKIEF